jgi:hypothetical protein
MTITFQEFVNKAQSVVDAKGNLVTAIGDAAAKATAEAQARQLRQEADVLASRSRDDLNARVSDLQRAAADLGSLDNQGDGGMPPTPAASPLAGRPSMADILRAKAHSLGLMEARNVADQAAGSSGGVPKPRPRFGVIVGGLFGRWTVLAKVRNWLRSLNVPPGTLSHAMIMVAADLVEGKHPDNIVDDLGTYLTSVGIDVPKD